MRGNRAVSEQSQITRTLSSSRASRFDRFVAVWHGLERQGVPGGPGVLAHRTSSNPERERRADY